MSDEKPKPVDDLKEGLGLLFRAAKGAVERLPTGKIEHAAKDAVREVGRAFESLGTELEKVVGRATGAPAEPHAPYAGTPPAQKPDDATNAAPPSHDDAHGRPYDDAYAPEEPRGPRVG